jgi:anaerobic selenocysteine-containing dehydrogenase
MGIVSSRFPDRLWNKMNTPRVGGEICAMAGAEAMIRLLGRVRGTEPQHLPKTQLYVAWGKNPRETNVHFWSLLAETPYKVVVDPFASRTAQEADLHIQPRPGTDAFLAIGVMKILLKNNWIDQDYIEKYTTGFEALERQLMQTPLSEIVNTTGVAKEQILELARLCHEVRPGLFHIGVGLQRNLNGGEMVSAVCMLGILTGQVGVHGGGVLYANYDWQLNDISYGDLRADVPKMYNMIKLGKYLTQDDHLKALFVYNQNPAATCPNQNLVRQGLARDDLFVVVHDLFLTDTAQLANVVLPATSFAETPDLQLSYWHDYVQVNNQAISPVGQARSNHWLIQQLANYMDYTEECFSQTEETVIREALVGTGLDYDELTRVPVLWNDIDRTSFDDHRFPTPSGKIELFALNLHRSHTETHQFRFLTPKTIRLQGSQYGNMPEKLGDEQRPWVYIHPEDAEALGISNEMPVSIWNERGSVELIADISDRVQPGLLVSYMVRWGNNANATTSDEEADMGGNSTFHSNYVSISPKQSE